MKTTRRRCFICTMIIITMMMILTACTGAKETQKPLMECAKELLDAEGWDCVWGDLISVSANEVHVKGPEPSCEEAEWCEPGDISAPCGGELVSLVIKRKGNGCEVVENNTYLWDGEVLCPTPVPGSTPVPTETPLPSSRAVVDVEGLETGVSMIAAGSGHTCALIAGSVKCWGDNGTGELGIGTDQPQSPPVDVADLGERVTSISADSHTCALLESGGVKCWGWNEFGQVGDGTTTNRSLPVKVSGLESGVTAISVGDRHTCALVAGGVRCWGWNAFGQLGDGTEINSSLPVNVVGLDSGVIAIYAGGFHTCALLSSGNVKCWGDNLSGQLGDGTFIDSEKPVNVSGLDSGVVALTAGLEHNCALMASGEVKCWGDGFWGKLGNNSEDRSNVPVNVVGLSTKITAITAGAQYTCALTTAGAVYCWGSNQWGQLGKGTDNDSSLPVNVVGLDSGVIAIDAGVAHTCALMVSGTVKCWGLNDEGQLGNR